MLHEEQNVGAFSRLWTNGDGFVKIVEALIVALVVQMFRYGTKSVVPFHPFHHIPPIGKVLLDGVQVPGNHHFFIIAAHHGFLHSLKKRRPDSNVFVCSAVHTLYLLAGRCFWFKSTSCASCSISSLVLKAAFLSQSIRSPLKK